MDNIHGFYTVTPAEEENAYAELRGAHATIFVRRYLFGQMRIQLVLDGWIYGPEL